ncbi:hypothetical protein LEP1GSC040_1116 [Leptospira santarosai str. 2000030832]|nr:hypothetical protein LEP1GSC040_1116 [Leptospira santarosai str. 2000030832]
MGHCKKISSNEDRQTAVLRGNSIGEFLFSDFTAVSLRKFQ